MVGVWCNRRMNVGAVGLVLEIELWGWHSGGWRGKILRVDASLPKEREDDVVVRFHHTKTQVGLGRWHEGVP